MSGPEFLLLALAVTIATAAVDFAHARYAMALADGRAHTAARWSVAQWLGATAGLVLAVRVSWWLLPFEAVGLYLGTWSAARTRRGGTRVQP